MTHEKRPELIKQFSTFANSAVSRWAYPFGWAIILVRVSSDAK